MTEAEVMEEYVLVLTREQIKVALVYAANVIRYRKDCLITA
jgi:uncharacterized protein (DUF433 family)